MNSYEKAKQVQSKSVFSSELFSRT